LLHDAPGIVMPPSLRIERADLERLGHGDLRLEELLPGAAFPLIVRPVDSHAGHDLAKLDAPQEIAAYLANLTETRFFLSPFMDYRDADGLYRKYRVVLIGGRAYAGHMGISDHWMIHYLNAGMRESAAKRAEEARFMERFEEDFARRHAAAIEAINQRLELDYLVIDCAETESGELLIFEVDTGAIVHSMDPSDLFPYKLPAMHKVFEAFRALLAERASR
jgi:glutathione synthase/RimK-type ligase-like ATP-grasp enzyme